MDSPPAQPESRAKPTPKKRTVTLGGLKESLTIIVLLVLLPRFSRTFAPIMVLGAIALVGYWYFRVAYFFGRTVGRIAVLVLVTSSATYAYLQYSAHQSIYTLQTRLEQFDRASVGWDSFPMPRVYQLFVEGNVNDEQLAHIIEMPDFAELTHVSLESDQLTDRSLKTIDRVKLLEYVLIECKQVTDEAIEEFDERHPDVSVIVPNKP